MTGIGGLLFEPTPPGVSRWKRLVRRLRRRLRLVPKSPTRFVVLCFRRTGSNWLCGMLFNHPQILMHNEIFNENGVHTYYKPDVLKHNWDYEGRDVNPDGFLEFMYDCTKFSKFRESPNECKAVGYKSFPNHYLLHAVPLASVDEAYQSKILRNPEVKKIILQRQDVVRTYISSRRAVETGSYMTKSYQDHAVEIDLVDMQRFVDRYEDCYEHYMKATRGHPRCMVTYEELCRDTGGAMSRIWHFLGVSQGDPVTLPECKPQSSMEAPFDDSIRNYAQMEFAFRHDKKLSKYFPRLHDSETMVFENAFSPKERGSPAVPYQWVLLIPVRAGPEDDIASCKECISQFYSSLVKTARSPPTIRFSFLVWTTMMSSIEMVSFFGQSL